MSKSKPKNGKPSSQDYMNLLWNSDSESDTVPDLKLPPLKGKKPKRRSATQRSSVSEESNLCSPWVILKVVVVMIMLCSIVTLGVVTYWSLQQITELKDQINALENKNAGTPEEFESLKMKLLSVNKSVADMKSGKYGLDVLNNSIVQIQKQISTLQATTAQLQKSDHSTDSTASTEHKALADTVATIGSDLQSVKTDVDSVKTTQKELTSQLEALGNRVTALENPGGREGGASAAPVTTDLQELLTQINATFTQSISKVVTDVNKLQTHLDAVDKFSLGLQGQMSNLSQQVANLTQAQAHWQGANTRVTDTTPEDEALPVTAASLHELQNRMEHLQDTLEKIQTDHDNLTQTAGTQADSTSLAQPDSDLASLKKDHEDFLLFKTEVFQDITSLNSSLAAMNGSMGALNTDVEELFAKVGVAMTEISNVTSVVEGLTDLLQAQKESKDAEVSPDSSKPAQQPEETARPSKTTLPEGRQSTTTHEQLSNKSTTTVKPDKSEY